MDQSFKQFSMSISEEIIAFRRSFHKYAETGWLEFRTASLVARELSNLGFTIQVGKDVLDENSRMGLPSAEILEKNWQRALNQGGDPEFLGVMKGGFTGVVGEKYFGDGPTIALRFDMDALEITESQSTDHFPFKEGFSSENSGMMHACGHDCHTAIGLGLAKLINHFQNDFRGRIKLIFQPAEEGVRGAKSMVKAGILNDVDYVIGHHVYPGWNVGEISCGMGGYAATEKFDVIFDGAPSHAGGSPEIGKNAMLAAATAITNLYAIPRHSEGFTRINVGKIVAGSGRNVICPKALMVIETRGESNKLSSYMRNKAENILKSAASMYDCNVSIKDMGSAITGESDSDFAAEVGKIADKIGDFSFVSSQNHSGGSEDFTYMMEAVQKNGGKATNIGIGADINGISSNSKDRSKMLQPHTFNFDVKEDALEKTVYLLSSIIYKISKT